MLTVMHRLLLLQLRASQKLPLMRWPLLYETLIAVASFLGREEILVLPCAGEAAIRLLQVINLLIATGDSLFPSGALFESFAYEIVRQHRIFETLYRLGKKHTKQLTGALSFARSMIVQVAAIAGIMCSSVVYDSWWLTADSWWLIADYWKLIAGSIAHSSYRVAGSWYLAARGA